MKANRSLLVPDIVNLFLAPLFTELPLVLDITLPHPSALITQFIAVQEDALGSLKEQDYGKTLQLLTPKRGDWVLFNVRWRTVMFPSSVDAFWSSEKSRDGINKKDLSDCYLVLPVLALFGNWLEENASTNFYSYGTKLSLVESTGGKWGLIYNLLTCESDRLIKHYAIPEGRVLIPFIGPNVTSLWQEGFYHVPIHSVQQTPHS